MKIPDRLFRRLVSSGAAASLLALGLATLIALSPGLKPASDVARAGASRLAPVARQRGNTPAGLVQRRVENVIYQLIAPSQFPGLFTNGWYCPPGTIPSGGNVPGGCIAVDVAGPSGARDASQELFSKALPTIYMPRPGAVYPVPFRGTALLERTSTYNDIYGGPVFAALTYQGGSPVIGFFFYIGIGTPQQTLTTYEGILGSTMRSLRILDIIPVKG